MKKIVVIFLAILALAVGNPLQADAFGGGGHSGGGHFGGGGGGHFGGHAESSGHFGGGHFGGGHFDRGHFEGRHFRGHGGVDFVVDPFGPWWWDGYPYGYPYPYQSPVVLQSEPESYLGPQAPEQQFWYYCSDPSGYYPYVNRCAKGWLKVVPTPAPSAPEP